MLDFVINSADSTHGVRICDFLSECNDLFIAVAFLRQAGLRNVLPGIESLLCNDGEFTAVIGTDFFLTEPAALEQLFELTTKFTACNLYLYRASSNATFHPKYYRFRNAESVRVVVGSANLTGGGLTKNIEISANTSCSLQSQLDLDSRNFEKQILRDTRCFQPSLRDLDAYASHYSVMRRIRKTMEAKARKELKAVVVLSDGDLNEHLRQYRLDEAEQTDLRQRKTNYEQAKVLITDRLLLSDDLSLEDFRDVYGLLVGERGGRKLWHSGNVHRSKNQVLPHYTTIQGMIKDIAENLERPVEDVFQCGTEWLRRVPHLGPNVLTEVLNTLRPEKFPILNLNPTTSMERLGLGVFPNPIAFKPEDYARFCKALGDLRDRCSFADFGETDHFLNYIYWATRPKDSGENE